MRVFSGGSCRTQGVEAIHDAGVTDERGKDGVFTGIPGKVNKGIDFTSVHTTA